MHVPTVKLCSSPIHRFIPTHIDTCYSSEVISLREARTIIAEHTPLISAERCPLVSALGTVLRTDIRSPEDIPGFDRSAMDGYAIRADETCETFQVVGEMTPGAISEQTLLPGECVRIFTGAAIPVNAGRVLPQEWVTREGDRIVAPRREGPDFIRRCGEDARRGDVLLEAGVRLGTGELSLLAQIGEIAPLVSRRPRTAHIATGDELVPPDQIPVPGQIRDSNSTLIAALLQTNGSDLVVQERCSDEQEKLVRLVHGALEKGCDLLLVSGGASVGDYDFGPRVLEQLGFTLRFRQLDLKPGKPLVFATKGHQIAFVIPGNPVSHFVTFHVAVRFALNRLQGANTELAEVPVQLLSPIPLQKDPRETYWPARVTWMNGRLTAQPLKWQSSGDLRGLVGANGLLQIMPGTTPAEAGKELPCVLVGVAV